jgi:uncharacterized protein with HEPN domain
MKRDSTDFLNDILIYGEKAIELVSKIETDDLDDFSVI